LAKNHQPNPLINYFLILNLMVQLMVQISNPNSINFPFVVEIAKFNHPTLVLGLYFLLLLLKVQMHQPITQPSSLSTTLSFCF